MDKTDRRRVMGALSATGLLLSSGSAGGQAAMEAPLNRLKKEARKIAIKSVTTFDVMVPPTAPTPPTRTGGPPGRTNVTCVETVSGVKRLFVSWFDGAADCSGSTRAGRTPICSKSKII